jgi:hypothetical protein
MTDPRVVVRYDKAVPRAPGVPARFVGESYTVTDAATAEEIHPGATIVSYADRRPFVRTQDASLAAKREAEAKAAEREAAKAAKAETKTAEAKTADAPKAAETGKGETKGA